MRARWKGLPPLAGAALLAGFGCAASDPRTCSSGEECSSGVCLPTGTCAATGADAGHDAWESDAPRGDGPTGGCANHDGAIAREEVTLAAGLSATFRFATDATVQTAGTAVEGGERRWDLSGSLAGDRDALVETLPVEGQWFASTFPGATYAARLSGEEDLLGVFEATPEALLLRGVVSPTGGAGKTELTYDPPVPILAFPLAIDAAWTAESGVRGWAFGVLSSYSERYDSRVDAKGTLATPFGEFPVLRVRTLLTRTVGVSSTITWTYLFASECFGTVAAIVSKPGETNPDFTNASEVRRLAP